MIAACVDPDFAGRCIFLGRPTTINELDLRRRAPLASTLDQPLRLSALQQALSETRRRAGDEQLAAVASHGTVGKLRGHILVAEDNAVNAAVIEGMLEALGLEFTIVEGGREAVARAAAESYAAILMDMHMPDLDGRTAATLIRKSEAGLRRTPIIALTADPADTHRQACLDAGMDDFLGKPVTLTELYTALAQWLPAARTEDPRPPSLPVRANDALARIAQLERPERGGLLQRVAAIFVASTERQIIEIRAALSREDLAAVRGQCHALKSAAAHVGATELSMLATEMEARAAGGDSARVMQLADSLFSAAETARNSMQQQVQRQSA